MDEYCNKPCLMPWEPHPCLGHGTLIFKWSEVDIPLRDVLKAIKAEPLFGHRSGKNMNTHWLCFMKMGDGDDKCRHDEQ